VAVQGDLVVGEVRHTRYDQEKVIEYVAGVDRYPNPEHAMLVEQLERDRRAFRRLDADAGIAEADCDTAESVLSRAHSCSDCEERTQKESFCNRAQALEDVRDQSKHDLSDLEFRLRRTPAIFEQE